MTILASLMHTLLQAFNDLPITTFILIIDIAGTFTFAVSGALAAMEKKLDPFGVLIISFVTSVGGGTLRDVLVGKFPVWWINNEQATLVVIAGACIGFFFGKRVQRFASVLTVFDALGLGLFTIVGIEIALQKNLSIGICIALGTITACFGGVTRDVLLNNVPLIFRKEIYATVSIVGGMVYFIMRETFDMKSFTAKVFCIILIFALRMIVVSRNIALPDFYRRANDEK
jgi:uncharacterized membrane protein YeiH